MDKKILPQERLRTLDNLSIAMEKLEEIMRKEESEAEPLQPFTELLREMERSMIRLAHRDLLHILIDYNEGLKHLLNDYEARENHSAKAVNTLRKLGDYVDRFINLIKRADDMGIIV